MTVSDPGGSANSTIVSNLQVGTQYQVRVAAKTELGVGPNSYGTTQVMTFNGAFSGCIHMTLCQSFIMCLCLISNFHTIIKLKLYVICYNYVSTCCKHMCLKMIFTLST